MGQLGGEVIYDALSDRLGCDLRGVVRYDGRTVDSALRSDVRAEYTDAEIREFVDETIVRQLQRPRAEQVLKLGAIEAVVRVYEQAWVVRIPVGRSRKHGCLVSVERAGDVTLAALEAVIATVEAETAAYRR